MSYFLIGVMAGRGITDETLQVLSRLRCEELLLHKALILSPAESAPRLAEYGYPKSFEAVPHPRINSHAEVSAGREALRQAMRRHYEGAPGVRYAIYLDDDSILSDNYLQHLLGLPDWPTPTLATGRTYNPDGTRWYDFCAQVAPGLVAGIPYGDAPNASRYEGVYCSGAHLILNRAGFELGVPHRGGVGEDALFSRDFAAAGGSLRFIPEIHVRFTRQHQPMGRFPHDPADDALLKP
jgi:hypothetical protein